MKTIRVGNNFITFLSFKKTSSRTRRGFGFFFL